MGTTWQEWQLFLDESGRVDGIEQSVVAGVLVPHARSVAWDRTLRQELLRRFPSMPYPMHAATLAYPISRVVGCLLSPEPTTPEERDVHERCAGALRALRRAPAHVAEPFFAMIAAGSRLSHQVLGVANGWLHRAHRYEAATLDALAHEQDRALAQLLRATLAADGCAVIGAAHLPRVDGAPAGEEADHYLPVAEALFERVRALLCRTQAAPVRIWVRAERRDVSDPVLGTMVPLLSRHLATAASVSEGYPCRRASSGSIVFVPDRPEAKSTAMHPGLVLADFASHRLQRAVRDGINTYRAIDRWLELDLGLSIVRPPRFSGSAGSLPTVASMGVPRQAVTAACLGHAPVPMTNVSSRWAREQAESWISALAGHCP